MLYFYQQFLGFLIKQLQIYAPMTRAGTSSPKIGTYAPFSSEDLVDLNIACFSWQKMDVTVRLQFAMPFQRSATVTHPEPLKHIKIAPTVYQLAGNSLGESIVLLSSEERGEDGVLWSYEARFSLSEESKRLKVEYSLTADQERELIAFNGPILYAGDGAVW